MTKTFKLGAIFFISTLWLILMRIAVMYIPLSDNVTSWLFSFLVQIIGMGLIPILLYKKWIGGSIKEDFHMKKKIHPMTYLVAVLVGFLIYYATTGVSLIYQNILSLLGYVHNTTSVGTIYSGWEVLAMQIITVAMLPAFFEEFIDRGLLLSVFKNEKNDKLIIVLFALIFAFGHQNITQTGYTFFGGLVIAFFAVKTKNIWPGVIVHFINNGLSVIFNYSTQVGGYSGRIYEAYWTFLNQNILVVMASWIAVGFIIVYLLKFVAKINAKEKDNDEKKVVAMSESIYKLFGNRDNETYTPPTKTKLWEYGMIIAALTLSTLATIFTFIWGVIR